MRLHEKNLIVDGLNISYYDNEHSSNKVIIFLHGWGADKSNLFSVYESLLMDYRVISIDLPGFGSSDRPGGTVGSDYYSEIIIGFLKQLSIQKVAIVGHSFGGKIGIICSSKYPEVISHLVLINSSGIKSKRGLLWFLKVYSYKLCKFFLLKVLHNQKFLDTLRSRSGSDDYRLAGNMRDILVKTVNEDLTIALGHILCPTFIYWGEKDSATPLWMGKKMHRLIKDSGIYIVKNGSHFSFLDDGRITDIIKHLVV